MKTRAVRQARSPLYSLARIGLFALWIQCHAASLFAQQPFFTDDAAVTAPGIVHFEFFNEIDGLQSSQYPNLRQNTANFKLNYGLPHDLELDVDVPYISISRAAGMKPSSSGPGDTDFGIKWNFRSSPDFQRVALAATFYIEVPTGNVHDELGSGVADYWLNFILQKPFTTRTRINTNLGFLFAGNTSTGAIGVQTTRGHVVTGGLCLLHDFNPRLTLGAEVYGGFADNDQLGRRQLQGLAGGDYTLREGLDLTFGLIAGKYEASPRLGGQIGFTVDLPTAMRKSSVKQSPLRSSLTSLKDGPR